MYMGKFYSVFGCTATHLNIMMGMMQRLAARRNVKPGYQATVVA